MEGIHIYEQNKISAHFSSCTLLNDFTGDIRRTDKFYCSQLVWAAYYYSCGFDLDLTRYNTFGTWRIHPKEIYDADTALIYRKK